MGLAGREYVVVGFWLLQHQMHRANVVGRVAPVATRIEVSELDLVLQAVLDARDRASDLAGGELRAATRRLVIEADDATRIQAVRLPVVHGDVVPVALGLAVRRARM